MKIAKTILLVLVIFGSLLNGTAQNQKTTFELVKIELADSTAMVHLRLKALEGRTVKSIRATNIQVLEKIEEREPQALKILKIDTALVINKIDTIVQEDFTIEFLVDITMKAQDLQKTKDFIRDLLFNQPFPRNSRFVLTPFNEEIHNRRTISPENVNSQFKALKTTGEKPDLYRALFDEIRYVKRARGKRFLFVFSGGNNEVEGLAVYDNEIPYDKEEVTDLLQKVDSDFYIFPISFATDGRDTFLQNLPPNTSSQQDRYYNGKLPDNLVELLRSSEQIVSTHLIKVKTIDPVFTRKNRTYIMKHNQENLQSNQGFRYGSPQDPYYLERPPSAFAWLAWFFAGAAILFLAILGSKLIIPWLRRRHFLENFVHPYQSEPNRRRIDPLTREVIQSGELVVKKCRQVTPLATWEGLGWQCPNYPDCLDYHEPCGGEGAPEGYDKFFSMQGPYRNLNWMWFGTAGGFLAWVLYAIFKNFDFPMGIANC